MSYINWYLVAFSALWILGLSLVTTGLSLASYLASQQKKQFRQVVEIATCRIMIISGLVIFCIGLAGLVSALWGRLLWAVLALIFSFQIWKVRKLSSP